MISVNRYCEGTGPQVEDLMVRLGRQGFGEKVWVDQEAEWKRINGVAGR